MKKKKKGMVAQIMAWMALFAIVIGIVGTGFLVIFSGGQPVGHSGSYEEPVQNLSQEDLQRIIDQSSVEVTAETVEGSEVIQVQATATGSAQ